MLAIPASTLTQTFTGTVLWMTVPINLYSVVALSGYSSIGTALYRSY